LKTILEENNTRSIASDNKSSNDKSSVMPLALVSWAKNGGIQNFWIFIFHPFNAFLVCHKKV
jgi:hypothetical protein